MKIKKRLKKYGNSVGVYFTIEEAKIYGLKDGSVVHVIKEGRKRKPVRE